MGVVEAAPVSTRLNTLHDEAVHAGLLGELGLLDRRDGDPDRDPASCSRSTSAEGQPKVIETTGTCPAHSRSNLAS